MDRIKDITKIKIPANHVLLEVVRKEEELDIDLPDDSDVKDEDLHSKVTVIGSDCKRLDIGDIVFVMQHEPVGFKVRGTSYILTFEDNCAIASNEDNVDFDRESEIVV